MQPEDSILATHHRQALDLMVGSVEQAELDLSGTAGPDREFGA
jgi:hypothetical protein